MPYERAPHKRGAPWDLRNCTPHNPPVLYAPAGREICAGQSMYVPGLQSPLYKRLPIQKHFQQGAYAGPYWYKDHDQHGPKHWGGPRSCSNPLSVHPLVRLSPRRIGVIAQRPRERIGVAYLTISCQNRPRGPRNHQDRRPWYFHTSDCWGQQNKFKLGTTKKW